MNPTSMKLLYYICVFFYLLIVATDGTSQCAPPSCDLLSSSSELSVGASTWSINYEEYTTCTDLTHVQEVSLPTYQGTAVVFYMTLSIEDSASQLLLVGKADQEKRDFIYNLYRGECDDLETIYSYKDCRAAGLKTVAIPGGQQDYILQVVIPMANSAIPNSVSVSVAALDDVPNCEEMLIDGTNTRLSISILDRSVGVGNQPFVPLEVVTFEIVLEYTRTGVSQLEWLHSIIPSFGNSWDLLQEGDSGPEMTSSNGREADWTVTDIDCGLSVQADLPYHCTYILPNGQLELCNMLTEDCPCSETPVSAGDQLPTGWAFSRTTANCIETCSPSSGWGVGNSSVTVVTEIQLQVKGDAVPDDDLQIVLHSFSDVISGCFDDLTTCLPSYSSRSLKWKVIGSDSPAAYCRFVDPVVCYQDTAYIDVVIINGTGEDQFLLSLSDKGSVTGDFDDLFVLSDTTVAIPFSNETDSVGRVVFDLWQVGANGNEQLVKIVGLILPEYKLTASNLQVCPDDCQIPIFVGNHNLQDEIIYLDSLGPVFCSDGEPRMVVGVSPYCGTDTLSIGLEVWDRMETELTLPRSICRNGVNDTGDDGYYIVLDTIIGGQPPYDISWLGSALTETEVGGKPAVQISEEIISSFGAFPRLQIVDTVGCRHTENVQLTFLDGQTIDAGGFCRDGVFDPSAPLILLQLPEFTGRGVADVLWLKLGSIVTEAFTDSTIVVNEELSQTSQSSAAQVQANIMFDDGCETVVAYQFVIIEDNREFTIEQVDFEVDFQPVPVLGINSILWDFGDGSSSTELFPTHIYGEVGEYDVLMTVIDDCDTTLYSRTITINGTPVAEVDAELPFQVYPSPIDDVLHVESATLASARLQVFTMSGSLICSQVLPGQQSTFVECEQWPSGVYLVKIFSESDPYIMKVIKP